MPSWRKGQTKSDPPVTTIVPSSNRAPRTNPADATSLVFFDVVTEFSSACADVWPNDPFIKEQVARLALVEDKKAEGLRLAKLFHNSFANKYSAVVAKDGSFFAAPEFSVVNGESKFEASSAEQKATIWEYFRSLVQYAGMVDMYSKCPQGMLDSISNLAGGLMDRMQNGELDASKINPLEIGQMMMSSMNSADLENFGNAIMNGGNMESMISVMQSTMGAAGMPDMSMFSSMLPK